MGILCKAKNCTSEQHKGSNLSFHRFPITDQKLLKCWLDNIGLPNWYPRRQDSICSLHFADDQFTNTKPRRLVKNAVPAFLNPINENIKNNSEENNDNNEISLVTEMPIIKKDDEQNSNGMSTELSVSSYSDNDSDFEVSPQKEPSRSRDNSRKKRNSKFKFNNPRFPGDFSEDDLKSPERMKKMWQISSKQITDQRKKLKTLQQKNRRLECQVVRLKNLVKHLKTVHQ